MTTDTQKQPKPPKRPNWGEISEKADYGRSLRTNSPDTYGEWISAIRQMNEGADLGQVEPWSPFSVRESYYAGWADCDFGTLLNQLGHPVPFVDNKEE